MDCLIYGHMADRSAVPMRICVIAVTEHRWNIRSARSGILATALRRQI